MSEGLIQVYLATSEETVIYQDENTNAGRADVK